MCCSQAGTMIDMNKNTVLAIAGVCGTAFIGYCVYFDRKRRSDPDFRRKLKERRQKQRSEATASGSTSALPDLRDVEAVQKFFIDEVQRGEELLGQGNYQEAVEHLTNAVAVCGQPQQLLQILQQTLPQPVFAMLLERLPSISQKLSAANPNVQAKKAGDAPTTATITDVDDLE